MMEGQRRVVVVGWAEILVLLGVLGHFTDEVDALSRCIIDSEVF